ncbi:solute carrier family 23 protein [Castellaniella sp.]|uniref:solute carrier family 23 protein n=1 Tax=Castellaniella sp. TaxID=1955812 RepID=UPI002AFE7C69|nr:solute carrier family 23 protein [Castellaniella sp.]
MPDFSKIALPPLPSFKRPHELLYAANDRPPISTLSGLALQHIATALALIAYVLAAAKIGGLDAATTQTMVTATVLGMAISTFCQSWGGRVGSGMLLIHMPDPLLVVISGMLASQYGLGGLVLVGVINGLVALGAGSLVPHLRSLLPPTVAGIVVCVAGLSLIEPALLHVSGLTERGAVDLGDLLTGVVTLTCIMALSIWGRQRGKLFALLTGLIVGIVFSFFLGNLNGLEVLADTPVFGLPNVPAPDFHIDIGVLLAVAVLALMTQLDVFGCVVLMHKMNDADWHRPDMKMVSGGMRACGIGNFMAAWLGALPTAISSANIALAHISRSSSRWIGLLVAALLALVAFLPQVSLALTLMPAAVIGAIEIYAAAYLIVSGIELIASRALDARGLFMIGLSFVLGIGVILVPQLAELAPESLRLMASNGIIVAGLSAITLNLLFRLGIAQRTQQELAPDLSPAAAAQAVVDFVESQGASWNARRNIVRRAAQAALEAAEAIQERGSRLTGIQGSFDEFNLDIELRHDGAPLALTTMPHSPTPDLLDIEGEQFQVALDQALSGISQAMLRRLADRLHSEQRGDASYLKLHFDH